MEDRTFRFAAYSLVTLSALYLGYQTYSSVGCGDQTRWASRSALEEQAKKYGPEPLTIDKLEGSRRYNPESQKKSKPSKKPTNSRKQRGE